MGLPLLVIGVIIAVIIVTTANARLPAGPLRGAAAIFALVLLFAFAAVSSIRYIGQDDLGVVVKNVGRNMPPGQIVAVNGEKGPQAEILGPGWHFWLWPGLFDVDLFPVIEVSTDQAGLITTTDGRPLPGGEAFAPEWDEATFGEMLDAKVFLTSANGYKGPQASVLRPGKWRINPKLYTVEMVPVTNVEKATVGVVKSNVGGAPEGLAPGAVQIVQRGERGIWREPYTPQKLYLNTKAYEVTMISTKQQIIRYGIGGDDDDTEIEVRTSDGFTFPVDVRIEYQIRPEDAPIVVAQLGDDQERLRSRLASTVRAIFRNNAETVKALDYVNQRSGQEASTTRAIRDEMETVGVTIIAVRIGAIAGDGSLAELLKTQTDREIAVEEQKTFKTQQLAAEQRKELTRTEQEAEEEKRLATATYQVKIADEAKQQRIIEAGAEAEAIRIKAEAQAEAYRVIAEQIGQGNAALVELLRIVGESGINITPRVMVTGSNGGGGGAAGAGSAETTALIGTMLDSMMDRTPQTPK